jgi:hypothetical protein
MEAKSSSETSAFTRLHGIIHHKTELFKHLFFASLFDVKFSQLSHYDDKTMDWTTAESRFTFYYLQTASGAHQAYPTRTGAFA